jgi:hypothetical protein
MPKEGPGHISFRELGPQLFSKGMEKNKNKNSKTWMILNFFEKRKPRLGCYLKTQIPTKHRYVPKKFDFIG